MAFINRLREDIATIRERDPAARSTLEIVLAYPGLHAVIFYRISNALWRRGVPTLPRLISHLGRFLTGIEIHPGATIGRRFFIDHGMGVVIGETAIVGDDVTLYQGVTLGGTGKERGKRHPTLGNDIIVGVGAKVLGAIEIGDGARIGGGSVVLKDVPPHTTAVGVPARAVAWTDPHSGRTERKEHLPDPTRETLRVLADRIDELEQRLREMEAAHQQPNVPVSN
ncbi:MAG: serine O-acetyltransferase [Thermomicrobiales bacterium]|nr:serine O-acetyltransferase [Thermomicrobiales bacterium]